MTSGTSPRRPGSPLRRATLALVTAFATLVALLGAAAPASADVIWPPHDPFYAAPENLAELAPGEVIRSRRSNFRLGSIKLPYKSYQVLVRTTDRAENPIATVATIILPNRMRPQTGRRLVSYQTAYDGLGPACMPSYSLQTGRVALQGAEVLLMMNMLRRGWTIVTTDYEGPNNNWGVAATTARGVLDGIRGALQFEPAGLDEGAQTKVGMMGYSGGGNATAWANEYATHYAPELNIVGATYGGVGADLATIVKALDGELFAGIAFAGLVGVTSGYPEVNMEDHLNNAGKKMFRELKSNKSQCISDFFLKYPFQKLRSFLKPASHGLLTTPKFLEINEENRLGRWAPKAPTLWYHTYVDQMKSWTANRRVASWYCSQGSTLNFRTSFTEEHALQAVLRPWAAQDWIRDRFDDKPFVKPKGCMSVG